jgi:aspartyl-tRNA(Asn)/glutamyl-tRNA(Gln) amidotransferase subunit B
MILQGKLAKYEIVVGCEIHAQISTNSKLFSRSEVKFGSDQNDNVSLFDIAAPGQLPKLNIFAVKQAVKTGLALNSKINLKSSFDRKNYFYPDLPQGYQISQFYTPIVEGGQIEIELENGEKKNINITRIHLEQDAGKLLHDQDPQSSLVDLNRSGVALMEIVSEPDMRSPEEAAAYVKKIRSTMEFLETCDGDMEKGNLRCDANVSVRKVGEDKFGTRCEIKNLNSTRNIFNAIKYEANRQMELIENGQKVDQETRLFDALLGETKTMRSKEDSMDYRYFPDPDLPGLLITNEMVDAIRQTMVELPHQKKDRYAKEYVLNNDEIAVLISSNEISKFFEQLVLKYKPKLCATWVSVELLGRINKLGISFENQPISTTDMEELLGEITNGSISGKAAKDVLDEMLSSGKKPKDIIDDKGLKQVSNEGEIIKIIDQVLAENQDSVNAYKEGKTKLFGFFVGQTMKKSQGKANPQLVSKLIKEKLK